MAVLDRQLGIVGMAIARGEYVVQCSRSITLALLKRHNHRGICVVISRHHE